MGNILDKKKKEALRDNAKDLVVPVEIFQNRSLAPLEAISEYLKDVKGLSYHEIAVFLNRDDRTIWTCYNRAKKKKKALKNAGGVSK